MPQTLFSTRFPQPPPLPDLEDVWWGGSQPKAKDGPPIPFKIQVTDAELMEFKARLTADVKRAQATAASSDSIVDSFDYGTNSKYLTEVQRNICAKFVLHGIRY